MAVEKQRRCTWCREIANEESAVCPHCEGALHLGNTVEAPRAPRRIPGPFRRRSWLKSALDLVGFVSLSEPAQEIELRRHNQNPDDEPSIWLSRIEHGPAVLALVAESQESSTWDSGQHLWALELVFEANGDRLRRRFTTRDLGNARRYSAGSSFAVIDDGAGGWMLYPPLLDRLHLPK